MLKFFCFVGGLIALAAVGHVNILAGPGGYDGDHAPVIMAIIICSALAALAIGRTASDGQRLLAVGMFVCVAAAELYSFTTNAERYINARDIIQRASLGAGNSQKDAE